MISTYLIKPLYLTIICMDLLSSPGRGEVENNDLVINYKAINNAIHRSYENRVDVIDYDAIRKLRAVDEVALCVTTGGDSALWTGTHPVDGLTIKDAVLLAVEQAGLKQHAIEYGLTRIDEWPTAGFIVFKQKALIMDRMTCGTYDRAVEFSQIGDLVLMPGDVVCVVLMM